MQAVTRREVLGLRVRAQQLDRESGSLADTAVLDIARALAQLTAKAKDRSLAPNELAGGTFTVTNHGPLGGWIGTPIIKPPEVGILGVGAVADRAVVEDGQVVARPMMPLSLAVDHRVVDGDDQLAFATRLKALLADPVQLLIGG